MQNSNGRGANHRALFAVRFALASTLCASLAIPPAASPQSPPPSQTDDEIARIVGYSFTRAGALTFLETLTDTIGGRITGSSGSRQAADLILKTLKDAGFDSAHFEEYDLTSSWQHGSATGEIISPVRRPILIGTYGWAPGTPGPIEVPVVDFGPAGDGTVPIPPQVKGAAVIVDLRSNGVSTTYVGARVIIARRLAAAGAAAMFIVSDKPDRMLYTSAFGFYPRAPLPVLSIPAEDAALLRRLLAHGAVKLRLDVQTPSRARSKNATSLPKSKAPIPAKSFYSPLTLTIGIPRKAPTTTAPVWPWC